jgi:predicted hydrolase (HD superfamily)
MIDRNDALALLREPGPDPHLIQHALASEAVLRALAVHFGEDEEVWGLTGLLHDWDYPLTAADPSRHGLLTAERCASLLPEDALHAIRAHNGERNGCPAENRFDVALICGETVTGLVITAALVRPSGMEGMQASSLKKKMKDKPFAAAVNRGAIRRCADIGLELDVFLTLAVAAQAPLAGELGCAKS